LHFLFLVSFKFFTGFGFPGCPALIFIFCLIFFAGFLRRFCFPLLGHHRFQDCFINL